MRSTYRYSQQKTVTDLQRIFRNEYMLRYDYDDVQSRWHYEECANDYCRCSTIENIKIESVDLGYLYKEVLRVIRKEYEDISLQHLYCIERLFSIHNVYDVSCWELSVKGGYYGEEINGAEFSNEDKLIADIYKVLSLDTDDAIRYILEAEYGYVLPVLKDKTFSVYSLNLNEVHIPNDRYLAVVSSEAFAGSEVKGLLLAEHDKFKLIDGYHRYSCLMKNKKNHGLQFDYIVAEDKE